MRKSNRNFFDLETKNTKRREIVPFFFSFFFSSHARPTSPLLIRCDVPDRQNARSRERTAWPFTGNILQHPTGHPSWCLGEKAHQTHLWRAHQVQHRLSSRPRINASWQSFSRTASLWIFSHKRSWSPRWVLAKDSGPKHWTSFKGVGERKRQTTQTVWDRNRLLLLRRLNSKHQEDQMEPILPKCRTCTRYSDRELSIQGCLSFFDSERRVGFQIRSIMFETFSPELSLCRCSETSWLWWSPTWKNLAFSLRENSNSTDPASNKGRKSFFCEQKFNQAFKTPTCSDSWIIDSNADHNENQRDGLCIHG